MKTRTFTENEMLIATYGLKSSLDILGGIETMLNRDIRNDTEVNVDDMMDRIKDIMLHIHTTRDLLGETDRRTDYNLEYMKLFNMNKEI